MRKKLRRAEFDLNAALQELGISNEELVINERILRCKIRFERYATE